MIFTHDPSILGFPKLDSETSIGTPPTGSPLAPAPGDLFLGGFALGTKVGQANPPGVMERWNDFLG